MDASTSSAATTCRATTGCTRCRCSTRRRKPGENDGSPATWRTGRGTPSAGSCSPGTRTPSSSTTATRGTSRARSPRNHPIRSTRAGIHRRLRCRTTWCSSSAGSTRTTPSRPIRPERLRGGRTSLRAIRRSRPPASISWCRKSTTRRPIGTSHSRTPGWPSRSTRRWSPCRRGRDGMTGKSAR